MYIYIIPKNKYKASVRKINRTQWIKIKAYKCI